MLALINLCINNIDLLMEVVDKIILKQKDNLNNTINGIKKEEIMELITYINKKNNANIIITGVGKNENMAKHFVTLLNSIGYTSIFLSVLNSVHGDIGMVKENDIIIMLSRSGNTEELLKIAPVLYEKCKNIVGIFSNKCARLIKYCDNVIILPETTEIDKFNLIPTSSVTSLLVFINILVASMIEINNISLNDYSQNHPAGNNGNKTNLKCKNIMLDKDKLAFVHLNTKLKDCMMDMCMKRLRCAMVMDDKKLLGIITDGDIRRCLLKESFEEITVSNCYNSNPLIVNENECVNDINTIIKNDYRIIAGIPVVNDDKELVGLLTQEQIVKCIF